MVRISQRYATRACKQFEFTMSRIRLEALNGAFQGGGLSRDIMNSIDNKRPRGYTIRAHVTVQQ